MMTNECWWITGASSGIGEAMATFAAGRGVRLILSGRNIAELERVAARCNPDRCLIHPFDVREHAAAPSLVERAIDWAGRIDCLVNNAGISQRSLASQTSFSVYEDMIAIDLLAPIALTQAVLPHMIERGGGRLVAISSVAGIIGAPLRSAYSAAKHGLIGYFDSVRCENAHLGVKVHMIAPGSVNTNVSRNALNGDGSRRGTSDAAIDAGMNADVAAEAIFRAIDNDVRELILAEGAEADLAALRRSDPEALFDRLANVVSRGYAARMQAGAHPLEDS